MPGSEKETSWCQTVKLGGGQAEERHMTINLT